MNLIRLRETGPQWPYSAAQLRADEPRLSVSSNPHPGELASYAALQPPILLISYALTPQPEHNPALFQAIEITPVLTDGTWQQAWELVALPPSPPQPRWVEFGAAVQSDDAINQLIGRAFAIKPALGLGLGVGLGKAEDGMTANFLSSWAIAYNLDLISAELLAGVVTLAEQCDLPADFVAALSPVS